MKTIELEKEAGKVLYGKHLGRKFETEPVSKSYPEAFVDGYCYCVNNDVYYMLAHEHCPHTIWSGLAAAWLDGFFWAWCISDPEFLSDWGEEEE